MVADDRRREAGTAGRRSRSPRGRAAGDDLYQVVVTCRDEAEQRRVFERLHAEGYECRLLVI